MIVLLPGNPTSSLAAATRAVQLREALVKDGVAKDAASTALRLSMQAAGAAIEASADDLRTINARHSGVELTTDEVVVLQDYALHNQRLARRSIQFTRGALEKLATRAKEGRTALFDHQADRPLGSVFDADVVEETVRGVEGAWLRLRWYAVLNDETSAERRQLIQDCRSGVLRFGSCGLMGGDWQFQEVEDENGDWDYFWLIDDADNLDLTEYSRVYLGAAQGAGDHKFSERGGAPTPPTLPTKPSTAIDLCVL
ncbi:MAG: hypothetical protein AAGF99_05185 [Bacteroidota bacterium]